MKRLIPLFILILAASGCGSGNPNVTTDVSDAPTEAAAPDVDGTVMSSPDGAVQIITPDDWDAMSDLNAVAIIQAANLVKEQYIIVIDDSKEEFEEPDLAQYSDVTSQLIVDGLVGTEVGTPTPLTINGNSALQKEIKGTIDDVNVAYLHTSIETDTHFYQLLAWTLTSQFDKNGPILKDVTNSFQEAR